jgi:hypothetical protein
MQELSSALMTIIFTRLAIAFFTQRILPTYLTKFSLYRLRIKAQVWATVQDGLDFTKAGLKGAATGVASGVRGAATGVASGVRGAATGVARGAKAGLSLVNPLQKRNDGVEHADEAEDGNSPFAAAGADGGPDAASSPPANGDAWHPEADDLESASRAGASPANDANGADDPFALPPPPPPPPGPPDMPAPASAPSPSAGSQRPAVAFNLRAPSTRVYGAPIAVEASNPPAGEAVAGDGGSPRSSGVLRGFMEIGSNIVSGVETAVNVGDDLVGRTLDLFGGFLTDMNKLSLEYQAIQPKYAINRNVLGTFNDYNELVIGFGYMVMFAAAFPICPAITLGHNIIQSGTHGFKLLKNFQKPKYYGATDIGMFWYLLLFLTIMSVGTNTAIICYTSSQLERYIDSPTTTARLATAMVLEHLFGLCVYLVLANVSDFRPSLRVQLAYNDQIKEIENAYAEHRQIKRQQLKEERERERALARGGDGGEEDDNDNRPSLRQRFKSVTPFTTTLSGFTDESTRFDGQQTARVPRMASLYGRSIDPHAHSSRVASVVRAPASATDEISPGSWEPKDPAERKLWLEFKRAKAEGTMQNASEAAAEPKPALPKRASNSTRVAPAPQAIEEAKPKNAAAAAVPVSQVVAVKPLRVRSQPLPREDPDFDINWDGSSLPAPSPSSSPALPPSPRRGSSMGTLRRVALFDPRTRLLRHVYTQSPSNLDVFFPFEVASVHALDGLALSELITLGEHKFRLVVGKLADSESVELTLRYVSGPLPHFVQAYLVAKRTDEDRIGLYRSVNYLFRSHTGIGFTHFASLSELRTERCYKPKHDTIVFGLAIASPKRLGGPDMPVPAAEAAATATAAAAAAAAGIANNGNGVGGSAPGAIIRQTPAHERPEREQREQTRLLSMSLSPEPPNEDSDNEGEQIRSPATAAAAAASGLDSFPELLSMETPRAAVPVGNGSHAFMEQEPPIAVSTTAAAGQQQLKDDEDESQRRAVAAREQRKRIMQQRAADLLDDNEDDEEDVHQASVASLSRQRAPPEAEEQARRAAAPEEEETDSVAANVSVAMHPEQPAQTKPARTKLVLPPLTSGLRSPPNPAPVPLTVHVNRDAAAAAAYGASASVSAVGRSAAPPHPMFRALPSASRSGTDDSRWTAQQQQQRLLAIQQQQQAMAQADAQRAKQLRAEAALRDADRLTDSLAQEQQQRQRNERAERLAYLQGTMPGSTRAQHQPRQSSSQQPLRASSAFPFPAAHSPSYAASPQHYAPPALGSDVFVRVHSPLSASHSPPPPLPPPQSALWSTQQPQPLSSSLVQPHRGLAFGGGPTSAAPLARGAGGGGDFDEPRGRSNNNNYSATVGVRRPAYGGMEMQMHDFMYSEAARARARAGQTTAMRPPPPPPRFGGDPSLQEVRPPPSARNNAQFAPPGQLRFW